VDAAADRPAVARLVSAIGRTGWAIEPGFIDEPLAAALRERSVALDRAGGFRPAAIGAGASRAVRPALRGDRLCWLGPAEGAAEVALFAAFETLRLALNRDLALGLFDVECHYAIYAPGAGYVRHLDRSPAGAERVISAVLYLNEAWTVADGGELRLHTGSGAVTTLPAGGTLVLFESARFEHEVLVSRRERFSIAGWFRRRARVPA